MITAMPRSVRRKGAGCGTSAVHARTSCRPRRGTSGSNAAGGRDCGRTPRPVAGGSGREVPRREGWVSTPGLWVAIPARNCSAATALTTLAPSLERAFDRTCVGFVSQKWPFAKLIRTKVRYFVSMRKSAPKPTDNSDKLARHTSNRCLICEPHLFSV